MGTAAHPTDGGASGASVEPALLPPLVSRSALRLYAPGARLYGCTLSAPRGLRSRGAACPCALCLEPALLPPFCALSAFLRPARRLLGFAPCSPLGGRAAVRHQRAPSLCHAPQGSATLRYAGLRYAPGVRSCLPIAAPPPMRSAWAYSLRSRCSGLCGFYRLYGGRCSALL